MLIAGLQLPLDAEVNAETMTQFMIRITKLTYEPLYETHLVHTLNCIVDASPCLCMFHSTQLTSKQYLDMYLRAILFAIKSDDHSSVLTLYLQHQLTIDSWPQHTQMEDIERWVFFIHWFTTHWYLKIHKNCMFSIFLTHFQHLQWYQRPNRVSPRRFEQSNFHRNTNRHVPSPHKQPIPVDIIN